MASIPDYKICFSFSLKHGDYGKSEGDISVTESVPKGEEPIAFLRSRINKEFKRIFSDRELPYDETEEAIS